jgi:CheY-like chemotaxis protein
VKVGERRSPLARQIVTLRTMAMGKRKSEQAPLWIPATELPVSPGHSFYRRLNEILDGLCPLSRSCPISPTSAQESLRRVRMVHAERVDYIHGSMNPPTPLAGLSILVVEDHPDNRDVLEGWLTAFGASVTTAKNADDGLRCFKAAPADVVLTDIAMPGHDGVWLCGRFGRRPTPPLPSLPSRAAPWSTSDRHSGRRDSMRS